MSEKYEAIFQPIKIGGVTLKNRVILCAMGGTGLFGHGEGYNEKIREYYLDRCRGNVGCIIPGVTQVKTGNGWLYEKEDLFLGPVKDLMDEIHSYGTKYFMQLGAGFGRAQLGASPKMDEKIRNEIFVAPSDGIPNVWNPSVAHRGLTVEEIHDTVKAFGKTALLCKKAGIDGIEIHAVHEGYLLDQFAVKSTNRRTDEYGGSLENRLRYACEIIEEIHRVCGRDYPVSVRFSAASKTRGFNQGALPGEAYEEFGRSLEEAPRAARILEAAGADLLNADNGSYDSWWWAHPPVYMPLHCNFPEVSYVKKFVNIPVFCAGRMEEPEFAAKAIENGEIDGIGVARQFLADPEWLNKVREGREAEIRPCIACHNGCFAIGKVPSGRPFAMSHCALNPVTMEEGNWKLVPAAEPKRIAIVGGGVGGMECARLLTMRGHKVTLFEKTGALGGAFIAAAALSFKENDRKLLEWYKNEMKRLDIDIRMNTEATEELLADFDSVILATGATPRKLNVPGIDTPGVTEAIAYLNGPKDCGRRVTVIGGGLTGVEIAYEEAMKGNEVTVVEMRDDILLVPGLCAANANMLQEAIRLYHINVLTNAALTAIGKEDCLKVSLNTPDGVKVIDADSVILSVGYTPEKTLYEKLSGKGIDLHVIGDAKNVGNLLTVIYDAYELSYKILDSGRGGVQMKDRSVISDLRCFRKRTVSAVLALLILILTAMPVSARGRDTTHSGRTGVDGTLAIAFSYHFNLYFDWFIHGDNTVYFNDFARFASVASNVIYSEESTEAPSRRELGDGEAFFRDLGMSDVQRINVTSDSGLDASDTTEFFLAHIPVEEDGKSYEIIIAVVRGSVTAADWISNADIGADTEAYYELTGEHPEWTDTDMHKGFCVTANRTKSCIDSYVAQYVSGDSEKIIFITGHSRGAAVANILGTFYEKDSEYKSFTYTIASPRTTTADAETASGYTTIFNIINEDDIVPTLPRKEWSGFKRYGQDIAASGDGCRSHFRRATGESYLMADAEYVTDLLGDLISSREALYEIDRANSFCLWGSYSSKEKAENAYETEIEELKQNGKNDYFEFILEENTEKGKASWKVGYYYRPAYVMEILADVLSAEKIRDFLEMDFYFVSENYLDAAKRFIVPLVDGSFMKSHMPAIYYCLTSKQMTTTSRPFIPLGEYMLILLEQWKWLIIDLCIAGILMAVAAFFIIRRIRRKRRNR